MLVLVTYPIITPAFLYIPLLSALIKVHLNTCFNSLFLVFFILSYIYIYRIITIKKFSQTYVLIDLIPFTASVNNFNLSSDNIAIYIYIYKYILYTCFIIYSG